MSPATEEVRTLTDDELHGVSGGELVDDILEAVQIVRFAALVVGGALGRFVADARERDPWQH
jgi:hypothetical protein